MRPWLSWPAPWHYYKQRETKDTWGTVLRTCWNGTWVLHQMVSPSDHAGLSQLSWGTSSVKMKYDGPFLTVFLYVPLTSYPSRGQGISFPSLLSPPALLPVILEATSSQAPSHVLELAGAGLPGLLAAQLVEPQAGNHLTLTNGFPLHFHVFPSLPRF